jgi:hypothetical protein
MVCFIPWLINWSSCEKFNKKEEEQMTRKSKEKNLTQKITFSITGTALCCSLVIGLVGILCIAIINLQSKQIYNDNLVPLNPVYQTHAYFQLINSDLKSMALEKLTGDISGSNYQSEINDSLKKWPRNLWIILRMPTATRPKKKTTICF